MLQFLFDTDHLTLYDHGQQQVRQRHVAAAPGAVGVSAVTIQEYLRGRLAAIARHPSGPRHIQAMRTFWLAFSSFSNSLGWTTTNTTRLSSSSCVRYGCGSAHGI